MKLSNINNTSVLQAIDNTSALTRGIKYKSKDHLEKYIGLELQRSSFYGRCINQEVIALNRTALTFNEAEDVLLQIEGVVVLKAEPVNTGAGDIVYKGYGVLEVDGVVVFDGRGGLANVGSDDVDNDSNIPGATVTDALNDLDDRVDDINSKLIKITYYEPIDISSGTSGSLASVPSGATISTQDEFGESGETVLSTLTGGGQPAYATPETGGTPVTATLDASGNWISSDTFINTVALIYRFTITVENLGNVNFDNVIDYQEATIRNHSDLNLDDGANPHGTTKTDIGLGNVDNVQQYPNTNPNGYETPLQLNTRDVNNRNRTNHTGTQLASTISNFQSSVTGNTAVVANTAKITNATHTGDVTGSGVLTITANAVTNAKAAQMAANTIKGRQSTTGSPQDLTATQATALLNTFTSALKGLVPLSGGGTTNFLRADGTWASAGGGINYWSTFNIPNATTTSSSGGTCYAIRIIPAANIEATEMETYIANPSVGRTVYMGIYSADYNTLLGEASVSGAANGMIAGALDSTVSLTGGETYWLAILEGNGAVTFPSKTVYGDNGSVARSSYETNSPTGMPADINSGYNNTTTGIYIAVKS